MGMRLAYVSVSPSEIDQLHRDPDFAPTLLMGDLCDDFAGLPASAIAGMQQQWQMMQKNLRAAGINLPNIPGLSAGGDVERTPGATPNLRLVNADDLDSADGDGANRPGGGTGAGAGGPGSPVNDAAGDSGRVRGELEKAWHGLHYVFTGRVDEAPPPLGFLLSGGSEVGEDLGYGPARVLSPRETIAFRDALAAISDAEFDRRFDVAALERAGIYPNCWDEDRGDLLDEYQTYFRQLRSDLDRVVAAADGLLIGLM